MPTKLGVVVVVVVVMVTRDTEIFCKTFLTFLTEYPVEQKNRLLLEVTHVDINKFEYVSFSF